MIKDTTEEQLQIELEEILRLELENVKEIATFTCTCGRVHEIETVPPESTWYPESLICACGKKITFGE